MCTWCLANQGFLLFQRGWGHTTGKENSFAKWLKNFTRPSMFCLLNAFKSYFTTTIRFFHTLISFHFKWKYNNTSTRVNNILLLLRGQKMQRIIFETAEFLIMIGTLNVVHCFHCNSNPTTSYLRLSLPCSFVINNRKIRAIFL